MNKEKSTQAISKKCLTCKSDFIWSASKYRPFCSERCKRIDQHHWLSGNYAVAGEEVALPEEDLTPEN